MGLACLILHEDDRGLAGGCEDSQETCTEGVTWGRHIASLRRVAYDKSFLVFESSPAKER